MRHSCTKTPSPSAPAWSLVVVAMAWPGTARGQSEAWHLFGMPYYSLGGVELLAFIVLVATYLLIRIVEFLRRRRFGFWRRWSFIVVVLLVWEVIGNWDIYRTSREADRLCREEGGLHVYRTVEAEGFGNASSIEYWSRYGFKYVESGGTRFWMEDGRVRHERVGVENLKSRYSWSDVEDHVPAGEGIERSSSHVVDKETGEELGRLVWFTIEPGRFDRLVLGLLPVEHNPWICGECVPDELQEKWGKKYDRGDLILATLRPHLLQGGKGK